MADDYHASVLKERRVMLGMTQGQVASAAGIEVHRYGHYEDSPSGIEKAPFGTVCKILDVLGLDIKRFTTRDYKLSGGIRLYLRNYEFDVYARGIYALTNILTVLAGSRVSEGSVLCGGSERTRRKLLDDGVIVDRIFTEDHTFKSPSEAASVIYGQHRTGTAVWYTMDGANHIRLLSLPSET